jgi:hypothetical protein
VGPASASVSGASWTIDGGHTARGDQGLDEAVQAGEQILNRTRCGTIRRSG